MTKKYTAIIDIDTLMVHAALAGQQSKIKVTGKNTGKTLYFKNRTEFYGSSWKHKDGGWLAEFNQARKERNLPLVPIDVFEIEDIVELKEEFGISAENIVKGRLKAKINSIVSQEWCEDFIICYGTGTNFRYDIAQTVPYKNERPQKPLLYDVVKEYMLSKYKDKLDIRDGVETDDIVASHLWKDWIESGRDHDKLKVVGVFIDKDIAQFPCLQYNFDKPEEGLIKITSQEAAENLAVQLLKGDTIDTIPGLPELTKEMMDKYKLSKRGKKGLGEKTARALVSGLNSPTEVFERVVEAYKNYYGLASYPFTDFNGEESTRTWIDHLNEQYRLLRMRTNTDKDVGHVIYFLKALGVDYE